MNTKTNTLKEVYVDELRDLHNCEQQLIKALPKMAKAATSEALRSGGFESHLEQTVEHARRLERVLQGLGEPVKGKKCKGMEGIIAEGGEVLSDDYEGAVMDAAIITAAQRVEHYRNRGLRLGARLCDSDGRGRGGKYSGTDTERRKGNRREVVRIGGRNQPAGFCSHGCREWESGRRNQAPAQDCKSRRLALNVPSEVW